MIENKMNKKKNKGHKPKRPTWPLKPTRSYPFFQVASHWIVAPKEL